MSLRRTSFATFVLVLVSIAASNRALAQTPADYQGVLTTLGRTGDFKDGVLKVNIPRSDLKVVIGQRAAPTPFGFGGWVALTKGTGGTDVMMGDLVLTEDEVNPVMSALIDNGLEVTALHNHFFFETPRIFYMHVHGHGKASDLAAKVQPALALIGKSPQPAGAQAGRAITGSLDTMQLTKIVGHAGEQNGQVYKVTVGRDDLGIKEAGAVINARMGLDTWAAFYRGAPDAAVAGD